jgi:outer membrane protein OmpA-like peptidoglycan-associated protein
MATKALRAQPSPGEAHWIPLSDLMTGLMMMFLLIAVLYMVQIESQSKKMKEVVVLYDVLRTQLYKDLSGEFANDLDRWRAEISKENLTIQFKEPDVLFAVGSTELRPKFKEILDDFFPRYIRILTSEKYRSSITELRIEGHTSSVWTTDTNPRDSYFLNMALSQERTRSTLQYVMGIPSLAAQVPWLEQFATANGLSFSKLVRSSDGREDRAASQRVEFRVVTDAERRIAKILEVAGE